MALCVEIGWAFGEYNTFRGIEVYCIICIVRYDTSAEAFF